MCLYGTRQGVIGLKKIKKILSEIFIDGLGSMAMGLFATLIIGTIIEQVGKLIGAETAVGGHVIMAGRAAMVLTGAGIGCAVATKLRKPPLVIFSAAVSGFIGAYASQITAGKFFDGAATVTLSGPGEPLGAFIAAYISIVFGSLVANRTKIDILVTPLVSIATGGAAGIFVGTPIASFMKAAGELINWGVEQQPVVMGIVVSVLMGIALTLPISSAAIGVSLGLSGIAAGAAVVGCCANMIGFAVASYKENKFGGLVAQGLGTSMLQMPNIVRKPVIWIPAIVASAVLGPIATTLLGFASNATGSGMGTAGLVGPLMTLQTMADGTRPLWEVLLQILVMCFIAPATISLGVSAFMRRRGWIKDGDMKLDL